MAADATVDVTLSFESMLVGIFFNMILFGVRIPLREFGIPNPITFLNDDLRIGIVNSPARALRECPMLMAFWRHLTVPEIWLVARARQAIVEFAKRDPELKPSRNSKWQSFRISRYSGSNPSCGGQFEGNDDNGSDAEKQKYVFHANFAHQVVSEKGAPRRIQFPTCPTSRERVSVTEATPFKSPVSDAQFGQRGSQHLVAANSHRISNECQDPTRIQAHQARSLGGTR
ncbi:hypothetical protein DFH09DRAFT_1111984 [Mycena vulgaris]|nr:hypothetical protein DFH09DRAFT_1111984 [Mycena vulgaris]